MSTLSERIRLRQSARLSKPRMVNATVLNDWADEVAELEARVDKMELWIGRAMEELSATDKLKQNYEKLGLSSALRGMGRFA